jgi:hypothetical protein
LELIGTFFNVFAGHWPAVFPEQRSNIQDTCTPSVHVRFPVHRKLLYAVPEIEKPEMAGANLMTARPNELE